MPLTLADTIEAYILRLLAQAEEEMLEVRRRELADRFSCAPSQINYVLETRFTPERGYIVRTRRGGGGGIVIIPVASGPTSDFLRRLHSRAADGLTQTQALDIVRFLYERRVATEREARLMQATISVLGRDPAPAPDPVLWGTLIRSFLAALMA